jgi:hypothetical protein
LNIKQAIIDELNAASPHLRAYVHSLSALEASMVVEENLQLREDCTVMSQKVEELQAELEKVKFVPGHFECAKCHFVLIAKIISVSTGTIGANTKPQLCANGCGPMWRVTWKDLAKKNSESCERLFEQLKAMEDVRDKH